MELNVTLNKTVKSATEGEGEESEATETTETVEVQSFVLSAANDWTVTATNLPKFENGQEVAYSWTEGAMPEGYELTDTQVDETGMITTLTNTYTFEYTEATVVKVWDDNDNSDGIRPGSLVVTLLANGEPYYLLNAAGEHVVTTVTLTEANQWTEKVTGLPMYKDGKAIVYSWAEGEMPEGYELTDTRVDGTVTTLTNTYGVEETKATVKKVWDDADDADGMRPAELYVTLSNGTIVLLNAENDWTATVEHLPKYAGGEPIEYTWTEGIVPEGYTLTNTEVEDITEGEGDAATVVGTLTTLTNTFGLDYTTATVRKVWADADNEYGLRPQFLQVTLLANGEPTETFVILSEENEWTATVEHLPKADAEGQEIVYDWDEGDVAPYTGEKTVEEDGTIVLTNTYVVTYGEYDAVKNWSGNAGSADLTLVGWIRDEEGNEVHVSSRTQTVSGNSTAHWDELPKYTAEGQPIFYTLKEEGVAKDGTMGKFISSITGDATTGWVVTNHYKEEPPTPTVKPTVTPSPTPTNRTPTGGGNNPPPEPTPTPVPRTQVEGLKIWQDENNAHKTRPSSITVELLADGRVVDSRSVRGRGNTWSYSFTDLPAVDEDGSTIRYTVRETPVSNYTTSVSGYTITNTLIPRETQKYVRLSGSKTWQDNDNARGKRPNHITVHLLRDGKVIQTLTVTVATNWQYDFGRLPADDGYGNTYTYTIREDAVEGYYSRINGMNVTNGIIEIPEIPDKPEEPVPNRQSFNNLTDEELEDLMFLGDYGTPLFGQLLGTGDETPMYPFVFGGIGLLALALLLVSKKRRKAE